MRDARVVPRAGSDPVLSLHPGDLAAIALGVVIFVMVVVLWFMNRSAKRAKRW